MTYITANSNSILSEEKLPYDIFFTVNMYSNNYGL